MSRRYGFPGLPQPSLADRTRASQPGSRVTAGPEGRPAPVESSGPAWLRSRPVGQRHCWVSDLPDLPGRRAGLLVAWRTDRDGRWSGRVVYIGSDDSQREVVVDAWVPSSHLSPADRSP